ncbi:hypothetical protein QTO34_007520 [Cnephaeus nilssonii]|uniref:UPAR/Ly6 domain-containing protein n=1 Tax=Cnephaeus nilssonii TaxID=3371016 RepID=A0AA40LHE8_CNENI|nr:hypothetical protein QTO34_007520 [Eptesicus nilssonii]
MTVLLAFLLAMGLPWVETNVTGTGRQGAMQCHACEEFYTLTCTKPTKCEPGNVFCVTVVVRMLVRYFYVSRQCTEYCPVIKPFDVLPPYKSYVLLKPTPFLYASCCRTPLCNTDSPTINDTEWHYYREAGGAHALRSGGAGLVLLLTLAAVSLGLRRS